MNLILGIGGFSWLSPRIPPPGYHPEVAGESMIERTKRACDALHDVLDGLEYHYPGEVNEDSANAIQAVLRDRLRRPNAGHIWCLSSSEGTRSSAHPVSSNHERGPT